ncbi:MAG: hypothetical protein LH606_11860 [Cytophagaceae bacterium]|nr:hypothetical protein [Cytophagaceae bacterium]
MALKPLFSYDRKLFIGAMSGGTGRRKSFSNASAWPLRAKWRASASTKTAPILSGCATGRVRTCTGFTSKSANKPSATAGFSIIISGVRQVYAAYHDVPAEGRVTPGRSVFSSSLDSVPTDALRPSLTLGLKVGYALGAGIVREVKE